MKKPLIGVMPLMDTEKDSLWMLPGYMNCLIAAGAVPLMLPLTDDAEVISRAAEMFDGFLFTGGHDVSPQLYGENPIPECGETCFLRDRMESEIFKFAMEKDVPVLGICRGIQLINVLAGGTLYQDLLSQRSSNTEHHQNPPYSRPIHDVKILPKTPLHDLLKKDNLAVNSYHHQAIKELSPKLMPMAISEDGLTEAVYMPGKRFVWAVQWHPEFSYTVSQDNMAIVEEFVAASAHTRCSYSQHERKKM